MKSISNPTFLRLLAVLLLSIPTLSVNAHVEMARNPLCSRAQLDSFVATNFDHFGAEVDFCKMELAKLPKTIREMMGWVRKLNTRAEKFYGLSISRLLPSGLHLRLQGSPFPDDSYFQAKTIILGAFPDWNPDREGNVWDDFTYLHELAHLTQLDLKSQSPKAIRTLARRNFFFESYPDFVAFEMTGLRELRFGDKNLHGCFDSERKLTRKSNFEMPYGFFTYYDFIRKPLFCCDRLTKKGKHNARTKMACKATQEAWDTDFKQHFPYPSEIREDFEPKRHCLDKDGKYSFYRCNDHSLGIPLNSFLFHLADKSSIKIARTYFQALQKLSAASPTDPALFQLFMKAIRDSLSAKDQKTFDALWEIHTLDTAAELDEMQPSGPARTSRVKMPGF